MSKLSKPVIVILLLGVVACVNLVNQLHPLTKRHGEEASSAQKSGAKSAQLPHGGANLESIKPVGSLNAKVRIKAILEPGNPCHVGTIKVLKKIAQTLPQRIRVEFSDRNSAQGEKDAKAANIGCQVGLLIDGKQSFEVMKGGKKVTIGFHGPLHMMAPDALQLVLVPELKAKYGGNLSEAELQKLLRILKDQAKIEGEAGGGHGGPGGQKAPLYSLTLSHT